MVCQSLLRDPNIVLEEFVEALQFCVKLPNDDEATETFDAVEEIDRADDEIEAPDEPDVVMVGLSTRKLLTRLF